MDNKFFTFIKPYLSYIDSGNFFRKPFSWLYAVIALLNLLFPLYLLYEAISNNVFQGPGKYVALFLIIWLIILAAGWISFQLWWDRMNKVANTPGDNEYMATPVFAHFVQTLGEWFGTWIAIVGTLVSILLTISSAGEMGGLLTAYGLPNIGTGIVAILTMPVYGFLVIVLSRCMAELIKALVAIAKNTKK